jgi:EmrB/QacA subfamily drug resistance transporter
MRTQSGPDARAARWAGLSVLLLAAFMDLVDSTIVTVTLPAIRADLHASYAQIQWVVAAYQLAFGLLLISGGRLGDMVGRKRVFLVAVAGFVAASAGCGLAAGPAVLIACRALQGAAAAVMVPQVLSMVQVTFPPHERPAALAAYGGTAGLAAVSGPLLGGLLTHADVAGLHWRSIFLVNVPVGLVALALGGVLLAEQRAAARPRLDGLGVVLLMAALLLVTGPLVQGPESGWSMWLLGALGGAALAITGFVARERRLTAHGGFPLVPLHLFTLRAFVAGVGATVVFFSGIVGFFVVFVLFLQQQGWEVLRIGLAIAPFSLGVALGSGVSVPLAPRHGRSVAVLGSLLVAAGMAALGLVVPSAGADARVLIPPLALAGLGMGLFVAPLVDIALAGIPAADAGAASGVLNSANQLGGAIGVAVVGLVSFGVSHARTAGLSPHLPRTLVWETGVFLLAGALSTLLPPRAIRSPGQEVHGQNTRAVPTPTLEKEGSR